VLGREPGHLLQDGAELLDDRDQRRAQRLFQLLHLDLPDLHFPGGRVRGLGGGAGGDIGQLGRDLPHILCGEGRLIETRDEFPERRGLAAMTLRQRGRNGVETLPGLGGNVERQR